MEGDFYRKPRKRKLVAALRKKLFNTRRRALITIVGFVLLLYVLFDNKGIIARVGLEMEKQEMETKIEVAKEETKQLQSDIKTLQGDKKTIEKVAREKHGMAREGETVYKVKKD
ncbi:MAG: septum formation initiator family protein [Ignavibacteriae bacterium]|nr:septum formation initiator family protein [Ignavibacteriota bacterium]